MRGARSVLGGECADLLQKCGKAALSYSTEFLLGEAFLWIWQIVKECEKYDERNYGRRIEKNDG